MLADRPLEETISNNFINYGFESRHGILVIESSEQVNIVYRSGCSPQAIIELHRYLDKPVFLEEVSLDQFKLLLTKKYEQPINSTQIVEDLDIDLDLPQLIQDLPKSTDLLESDNDAPIIRLINAILREAIKQSASDIHFETFAKTLVVRLRVDGILNNMIEVPYRLAPSVISRIKVMANLDIAEKRLPQDGRIAINVGGRTIDIRVSSMPVMHGERIVLRVLDKNTIHLNLAELGMDDTTLTTIRKMITKPHGIILLTGPTGSGKTTTLYAALTELNVPGRNIMTVEDPIEYDLPGIAQTQVNTKVEMDFARTLRAILRQDPNILMIGEIRDLETAIIAIQASLTGHLVFSTLHTNTAVGAIMRLRDMGVESFLISSSLIGVIAQRLIRLLCDHCKEPYFLTTQDCHVLGIPPDEAKLIYQAHGCEFCGNTGYKSRIGIYEIIEIDSTLRNMIHDNVKEQDLDAYARKQSPSIWQDSCQRVLAGETSLEEIIRVTAE